MKRQPGKDGTMSAAFRASSQRGLLVFFPIEVIQN